MEPMTIGAISLVLMLVLIWMGIHIAVVLMLLSFVGVWMIRGDFTVAERLLTLSAYESINNYLFGVVPLFVLMGLMVSEADVGRDAYRVAEQLFRRFKGGLGIATIVANAAFAAVTGISIASAAVFTKISVPEMLRAGYAPRLAVGVVAGSSVLGMLIPPSLLLIVYAFLADQSIAAMFLAGILPGIILATLMSAYVYVVGVRRPKMVGGAGPAVRGDHLTVWEMARALTPLVILIGGVLGGIYGGVFTPTEAGAAGAFGATVIALLRGKLTRAALWHILKETGYITVSICFLLIAASIYTRMLTMSGIPQGVAEGLAALKLGYFGFLAVFIAVVVVMGCVLDSTSILLITVPLMLPVAKSLGMDLVWFGIVTVIATEIGLLTPPFGLSVFVVKSTLNDESIGINEIFAGALPFVLIMLSCLILLIAFPALIG
ncbi:MAG: TRAP transporter large permease [Xanthobacteraceae bacterium]